MQQKKLTNVLYTMQITAVDAAAAQRWRPVTAFKARAGA